MDSSQIQLAASLVHVVCIYSVFSSEKKWKCSDIDFRLRNERNRYLHNYQKHQIAIIVSFAKLFEILMSLNSSCWQNKFLKKGEFCLDSAFSAHRWLQTTALCWC